jgi:hypothetical protein
VLDGIACPAVEREMDEFVHALYGLTPEEIKIVEESARR